MSTTTARGSGNHAQVVIYIEGLPSYYTWLHVKDLARDHAARVLRADIIGELRNNSPIRLAFVRLTRRSDADSLYEWLASNTVEGRRLVVHQRDGSSWVRSNCPPADRPCPICGSSQSTQAVPGTGFLPMPFATPLQYGTVYAPTPALPPPLMPPAARSSTGHYPHAADVFIARAASGMILDDRQQAFLWRMTQMARQDVPASIASTPPQITPQPIYTAAAASGAMINTGDGFARTEIRGVFVQGLDFKTTSDELEPLFARAGQVMRCEVQLNAQGKSKGTATVLYATTGQAQTAMHTLDRFSWRGMTLRVRSDREATVTKPPPSSAGSASESPLWSLSSTALVPVASAADEAAQADRDQGPVIANGTSSGQTRR